MALRKIIRKNGRKRFEIFFLMGALSELMACVESSGAKCFNKVIDLKEIQERLLRAQHEYRYEEELEKVGNECVLCSRFLTLVFSLRQEDG